MSGIVPIIIRLEIENKANFVEFSFSSDNSGNFFLVYFSSFLEERALAKFFMLG